MTRRAARTDTTHAAVRDGLRALGWAVEDLSHVGGGMPDLLVSIGPGLPFAPSVKFRGTLCGAGWCCFVEVKSPGGELTKDQQEFAWRNRAPIVVAESAEEAAEAIQALRRGKVGAR